MSTYDIPCSMSEANRYLKHILGSDAFVKQWWNSPNIKFNGKTPLEEWSLPKGDRRVMKFILYYINNPLKGKDYDY